jgi:DNA polymerase-3 subunit beta
MASISCGRSRFKLPTLAIDLLPSTPAIENETGCITLERSLLLTLLSKPAFAIPTDRTRYYLYGVFLHDAEEGLAAVATDGHRLARAVAPGISGLSQDRRLIVPKPAVKVLVKLLGGKDTGPAMLRRSAKLLEATATGFSFVSKLIDAAYPTYERLLAAPTDNVATVARAALARAVGRVAAVVPDEKSRLSLVGLTWHAPEPSLRLCIAGAPDLADDPIEAEASGSGRFAAQIKHLAQLLNEVEGERVRIDVGTCAGNGILITDPDDANFTIVQMPCRWETETEAA